MPKSLDPQLAKHYRQPQTTLTRCLRIERRDGKIIALTDHDKNLLIENIHYQSATGYTPTGISTHDQGAVNTVDVEGILSIAGVARDDIAAGFFDGAKIFIFEVNYSDLSQGILPLMSGFWGECQLHDNDYVTEFRSLSEALQTTIGELYSTTCRAQLGDQRCGVNLNDLAVEGVVTKVDKNHRRQFMAEGFDQSNDDFQYGRITWKRGQNKNLSMEIKNFMLESKQFQLVQATPYPIEVGDIFRAYPGCDKILSTCKNRFNNVVNFRGEPFIPGLDKMLRVP